MKVSEAVCGRIMTSFAEKHLEERKAFSKMKTRLLRNSVVRVAGDQVSCDLAGEVVILGLKYGEYYGLNELGARVWSLIQEPRKVAELLDVMLKEYDVAFDQLEGDVLAFLEQMADRELITIEEPQ